MSTHRQERPELEASVSRGGWRAAHDPHLHGISWQGLEKDGLSINDSEFESKSVCVCVLESTTVRKSNTITNSWVASALPGWCCSSNDLSSPTITLLCSTLSWMLLRTTLINDKSAYKLMAHAGLILR